MKNKNIYKRKLTALFLFLALMLCSCGYQDRVQPVNLPDASENAVNINGLKLTATPYTDRKKAKEAFGFDIRDAGLLPVQLVFKNDGDSVVDLIGDQTFLIDRENRAWPVISSERTYKRVKKHTDIGETISGTAKPGLLLGAAGAVAGLAVGVITGENIGEYAGKGAVIGGTAGILGGGAKGYQEARDKIRQGLKDQSLKKREIMPGQIAYGMIFFPGYAKEAQDAAWLKLTLSFNGDPRPVTLPLGP
ncbi:MAG: hypothetical protein ACQETC_07575 [Thermodesulfobacteriota bacterium]